MPIILFSSIFLLIAYVPNIFDFKWSKETEALIMKPYHYSMGIVGLFVAGTTAKALTDSYNRKLERTNQINFISTMLASMSGFLFLASNTLEAGGFANAFMGTKGLLTAFLSAFITVMIYNICIKNNITIKMPKEVPPNISQVFKDLIPFSLVILTLYGLDILSRSVNKTNVAESILKVLNHYLPQQMAMWVLQLYLVLLRFSGLLVFTVLLSWSLLLQPLLMPISKQTLNYYTPVNMQIKF